MAIKRARKEAMKPASAAGGCSGSSLAMTEMPPPHWPVAGANHIQQPPPPLPPGVYFSPTKEECLGLLNRSIAGDSVLPDARGYIFHANVYAESPDVLRRRHPPANTREGDHTWWFMSEARFQSPTSSTKRADRRVGNAGYWRLEQSKKKLEAEQGSKKELEADGLKNCFGFYTGPARITDKTAWLMQEFTSAKDDGTGKQGVPALYKVYVTPHATYDQLKDIYGEDGTKKWPDGKKKPARAVVPEKYFDAIAALLPAGSVRGVSQEHAAPRGVGEEHAALPQAPPPPPSTPVAPAGPFDYHGQQGQYLGQYHQGQHYQQHEQRVAPEMDIFGQNQQQGPFSEVGLQVHPLTPRGLLNEIGTDAPSENLSISMAEFMGMFNEQPAAVMGNEEPAEAVKEEPDWESLGNIVDDDELKNFNKEG